MVENILSKKNITFFIWLNLGLLITAIGIAVFKAPNNFAFGGTSGISIILSSLFPLWNVGHFMWFINIALIILGFIFLGVRSMGWTIYSSIALSFYVSVTQHVVVLKEPLTSDMPLEMCFAVILPAVGSAIVFNLGASSGGTDIVAMILRKYTSLEIGRALLISDLSIVLVAGYIFGPRTGLYCILGLLIKCTVVDSVIESLNIRKVCTVISSRPEEICHYVINDLHRSATIQKANGAYTGRDIKVVVTVLTRSQAAKLRNYIKSIDEKAFITVVNSSEIIGKGFRNI
ncbi:MAG: YitT family protein [Eubacteriales bacterium]|nr:YitT family protein [Eubacteriales bacterium]MDY3332159.1 YitT family protein [Gallibacter sp.]